MNEDVETAAGQREFSALFPSRWGTPEGTPFSEARLMWIEGNLVRDELRGNDPRTDEHSVAAINAQRMRILAFLAKEPV
jgi:hypothetical protein